MDGALNAVLSPWVGFAERWLAYISRGAFTPDPGRSALRRLQACVEQAVKMRGSFQLRGPVASQVLLLVTSLHAAFVAAIIAYPFVVSSRSHDGVFLGIIALVFVHWVLLKGECVLSYVEKRLRYKDYRLGDAPVHMWWADMYSLRVALALIWAFSAGIALSVAVTCLRNVGVTRRGVSLALRFGSAHDDAAAFVLRAVLSVG